MRVRLPDGTIVENVPDDISREDFAAAMKSRGMNLESTPEAKPEEGIMPMVKKAAGVLSPFGLSPQDWTNFGAGGIRGAGSIGATFARPFESAGENAQRRTRIDENMKNLLGADPESGMYQTGKIGGEVAGTAGVGGLLGKGAMMLGAPKVVATALGSSGMTLGTPKATALGAKAAEMLMRTGAGATVGGLSSLLATGDKEQALTGAAIGGMTPGAIAAAGKAGQFVGQAFNRNIAEKAAVAKAAEAAGDVPQTIANIQTHYPKGAENIPLSAAAITQNPGLAMLERASRTRSPAAWAEFQEKQGRAVFENVMKATEEAGEIGARSAARQENWQAAWQKASENQKPRLWVQRMDKLMADLDQAMQSTQSSNPAVRAALEEVRNDISRIGPGYTPGHLQQIRSQLNGQANQMAPSALKQADRSLPAIIDLKKELDDVLNTATGGKWQNVLTQYAKDSKSLDAARAAAQVRNAYVDPTTGQVLRGKTVDAAGDVPSITAESLARTVSGTRAKDLSQRLSPQAQDRIQATLDAMRKQDILQRMKNTGTGGGGSNTAMDLNAAGRMANAPNTLMQILGAIKQAGTGKTDAALAGLLSNPDDLARQLELYMRPQTVGPMGLLGARAAPVISSQ